jgi:O-antigen/teichoic acid export membrane protein
MAAVALYQPAAQFQSLIVQLVSFTNSAVIPFASHLHASRAEEKLRLLFLRGTKYTLLFVTPVIVVLTVLARAILLRWVGPEFALQASNARILLLPQLLIVGGVIGDSIITGQGKLPKRLPYSLAMTAGNLVLSIILVQKLGILGVVLGTAIPYLIDYPIHMWWLLRELDVPARRWFGEVVLPVYPLLAIPALLSLGALFTPLAQTLVGLGVAGAASVGGYYVAILAFALKPDERRDLLSIVADVRGRFVRS